MNTSTPEGRAKRQEHFDNLDLKNLMEKYHRTGNKKYLLMAEVKFGIGDYIPGYDDGEGPRGITNN